MEQMNRVSGVKGCDGYALLAVVVLTLVLFIGGSAFFMTSSYESKGALYRQNSTEAYYLADGAIERARARFLVDRTWRDGYAWEASGRGVYALSVMDTTYGGTPDVVRLLATGRVRNATRRIEAFAQVPPTAWGVSVFIGGSADFGGNLNIYGDLHVNELADFAHVQGTGGRTSDFELLPPAVRTEPAAYPGASYYYVQGVKVGTKYQARVFDRNMNDVTEALGAGMAGGIVTYKASTKTYTFDFNAADAALYFTDGTGRFPRNAGDTAVIVNFGASPPNPADVRCTVNLNGDGPVNATIINTRFTGVTDADRLNPACWFGGHTYVKQTTLLPRNGLAIIAYDFAKVGAALAQMGTTATPSLVYVTHDVTDVNSNFSSVGTICVLGDWRNTGGPAVTYEPAFIPNLPTYLQHGWGPGVSGTLRMIRWRELGV